MLGIAIAVIVMMILMTKAVMGIEPRQWDRTPRGGNYQETEVREEWITMDEYLDRTAKPLQNELKEIDGRDCIVDRETKSVTWCE